GNYLISLDQLVFNAAKLDPNKIVKEPITENGQLKVNDGNDIDGIIDKLTAFSGSGTLNVMDWGVKAITVLFILGVLLMIMSIIFKNGQWQKWGQSTMLWSFLAMLALRAIPLIILSVRSGMDVNEAFTALISSLTQIAIFLGVIGVLLSLLFKFAYKLIEHPEYHRWSKNVLNVSIIMMFFAMIGPFVFGIL
ncbi:hypothetical protein AB0N28_27505, partial [Streptomyces sp. NPDC051130]|uniref:hypothetical protein n=1 Tax=Streptomyces sp. NPDC051130 TaxID=3157223 RepID=UPI00343E5439